MNKNLSFLILVSLFAFKLNADCCGGCCRLQDRQADLRNRVFLGNNNITQRMDNITKRIDKLEQSLSKLDGLSNRLTILETKFADLKALLFK
jgi:hypothetical protein